jgi:atypical dual specificity phosphatase
MTTLNFSWLIEGKLAGHATPWSGDNLVWLKEKDIRALVRMAEKAKVNASTLQVEAFGLLDCYEPVGDFDAPTQTQIDKMVCFISKSLSENLPVGVSCGAGLGRTGTILACYLVSIGLDAEAAMLKVRSKRPYSIETNKQEEAVKAYAQRLGIKK